MPPYNFTTICYQVLVLVMRHSSMETVLSVDFTIMASSTTRDFPSSSHHSSTLITDDGDDAHTKAVRQKRLKKTQKEKAPKKRLPAVIARWLCLWCWCCWCYFYPTHNHRYVKKYALNRTGYEPARRHNEIALSLSSQLTSVERKLSKIKSECKFDEYFHTRGGKGRWGGHSRALKRW